MIVEPNQTTVTAALHDESLTVPSGEVWFGDLITAATDSDQGVLEINGVQFYTRSSDEDSHQNYMSMRTVLTGGDFFETDNDSHTYFSGWEVSDLVDNDPVSVQLGNESVTVPNDETWYASVLAPSERIDDTNFEVDAPNVDHGSGNFQVYITDNVKERIFEERMMFPPGTQLSETSDGAVHIGGWVI